MKRMNPNTSIREKGHRLPRELYRGQIAVAFTLCTTLLQDLVFLINFFQGALRESSVKAERRKIASSFHSSQ